MSPKKLLSLVLLSFLLVIATSINLCHTDGVATPDPYCPACTFQSSCVAIAIVVLAVLPVLSPAEVLTGDECFDYSAQITAGSTARPPPHV